MDDICDHTKIVGLNYKKQPVTQGKEYKMKDFKVEWVIKAFDKNVNNDPKLFLIIESGLFCPRCFRVKNVKQDPKEL